MKGIKDLKQKVPSPYWNELHVKESKLLLKDFGFDLQILNKDLTKPSNILCKKLLDSHV